MVEKILEPGEELPPSWACAGTTGYDVLALIDRVLTEPAGEPLLDQLSGSVDFAELTHDTKRAVADTSLQAEVRRIVRELPPRYRCVRARSRDAVAELLACFPVYRSYLPLGVEHLEVARSPARAPGVPTCCPRSTRWSRSCPTRPSRPRCGSSRPPGW